MSVETRGAGPGAAGRGVPEASGAGTEVDATVAHTETCSGEVALASNEFCDSNETFA